MVDIESIYRLFKARQINLPLPWLECCINWCLDENLPANYTTKDIQVKVFEQWLLVDLRVLEQPSLPANLSQKVKFVLDGKYSVQIMHVIDISKPKFCQLQKIRNKSTKNVDSEYEPTKRMLMLKLTDGVQEIEAVEYEPIAALNLNLPPGIKIGLTGPMLIRRGKIMLKSENVKIIGGEVDDLLIQNAPENVLAKSLNLPLSKTPIVIEERVLDIANENSDVPDAGNQIINANHNRTDNVNMNCGVSIHNTTSRSRSQCPENMILDKPKIVRGCTNSTVLDKEHEIKINDDEFEYLLEMEEEIINSNKIIDNGANVEKHKDLGCISVPPCAEVSNVSIHNSEIAKSCTSKEILEEDMDIFDDFHLEQQLLPEIWSIKKLNEYLLTTKSGMFKIRARFKSVVERVIVVDNKFYLVVNIEDDTDEMNVTFNSDIVANLLNCSPMMFMDFKDMNRRTPEVEAVVMKALKSLRDGLMKLDNVMDVQVSANEKHPIVIKII